MLKKALTTTVLATVLLTSSISANDTTTQGLNTSTAKVETIGAFDNIPTQNISKNELNTVGEGIIWNFIKKYGRRAWIALVASNIDTDSAITEALSELRNQDK